MTKKQPFSKGFFIGLLIFILANLLAAHLLSDCGLPALLGLDLCADDIVRAGFPFVFFEQGGFAYHSVFNRPFLILDLFLAVGFALISNFIFNRTGK